MTSLYKKLVTVKAIPIITHICNKLINIGLVRFNHDITFGNSEISMLTTNENYFKFYYKNSFPIICANDTGRLLKTGMYLTSYLINKYADCSSILPIIYQELNLHNSSIHIVERNEDCQHMYTLSFNVSELDLIQFILNHNNLIQGFIEEYKKKAKYFIDEIKHRKNRIKLPYITESDNKFSMPKIIERYEDLNRLKLKHMISNKIVILTPRQTACIKLALLGLSSKEIAKKLELSSRTVEHYLAAARINLGCKNLKELITTYLNKVYQ